MHAIQGCVEQGGNLYRANRADWQVVSPGQCLPTPPPGGPN